jgi:hypothetical protein
MQRIPPAVAAVPSLVGAIPLSGCVHTADAYRLPYARTAPPASGPPAGAPAMVTDQLVLPVGCPWDQGCIDAGEPRAGDPRAGEASTPLAVRTLSVRAPDNGGDDGHGHASLFENCDDQADRS